MRLQNIIQTQRDYFYTGETKEISFRKEKLRLLSETIKNYEERIYKALYEDLNKSEYEAYMTEISLVKSEEIDLSDPRQNVQYFNSYDRSGSYYFKE